MTEKYAFIGDPSVCTEMLVGAFGRQKRTLRFKENLIFSTEITHDAHQNQDAHSVSFQFLFC